MSAGASSGLVVQRESPHFLIRAVYFVLFGLWFSGVWAAIAWLLSVTIIGLPLGLWMLNRLPQVTTLTAPDQRYIVTSAGQVISANAAETPLLLRAVYFVLVGWWFSALWLTFAWALSASIIGLPIGFWMFNRVPGDHAWACLATIARPLLRTLGRQKDFGGPVIFVALRLLQ